MLEHSSRGANDKRVAIILLNWNSYHHSYECLISIKELNYENYHVFLVDNDSIDDSFNLLQKDYSDLKFPFDITFIQSGSNLGFAGGNNIGIRQACNNGFQYIWLLNNDTVVDPFALDALISCMEKEKNIGMVGSKIYYYNTNKIWFAGGKVNSWTGQTKHIGVMEEDNGQYNSACEVQYITGCSLIVKSELIESIGYMTEDYFLYYEETDWNLRAKKNGWKLFYEPSSIVYHKVSISSGGHKNLSPYIAYYDIRNCYVMVKRNMSRFQIPVAFLFMFWKVLKKHLKIIVNNEDRRSERSRYIFKGLIDGLIEKMGKHPT